MNYVKYLQINFSKNLLKLKFKKTIQKIKENTKKMRIFLFFIEFFKNYC